MRLLVLVAVLASVSLAHHECRSYSFGSCSDPSISFGFNLSSSGRWGYQPNNGNDFPHGWSPDIATIESFICNRLQSPCNATSDTVAACQGAFNDLSGLSGDNAVDAWSGALGIGGDHDHGDRTLTSVFMPDYATTVTTTVYSIEPGTSVFTTLTLVTSTTTTSTYTDYIFTTYSSPSPSSTLTITITLPALTATSESTQSTSVKTTISTQVYYTVTTMSATATAAGAENTQTPQSHGGNGDPGGDSGGGSPFDSGVGKASTAMYLCVLAALYLMIHNAA